jgi:hypothetical protein
MTSIGTALERVCRTKKHFSKNSWNRTVKAPWLFGNKLSVVKTLLLLPPRIQDWLPENDIAHLILGAVEIIGTHHFHLNH